MCSSPIQRDGLIISYLESLGKTIRILYSILNKAEKHLKIQNGIDCRLPVNSKKILAKV